VGGLYGFYRAKCIEADIEDNDYGAVRIWIPDLHTDLDPDAPEDVGLIALPGNNPVGGRNDEDKNSYGWGIVMIPRPGDWIWVFFEAGDPSKPFYFAALNIKNSKIPPEHRINQEGSKPIEPHTIYTILKTHKGRSVVVADSSDVERIEISGKYQSGAATDSGGDSTDPYTIDGNQTTILFDERDGKEKVLVRTHKGDFFHIDVDEQKLQAYFKEDITIKTDANFYLQISQDMHIHVTGNMYREVEEETHIKSGGSIYEQTDSDKNTTVSGNNSTNISGNNNETISGNSSEFVSGNKSIGVSGNMIGEVAGNLELKSGGNMNQQSASMINMLAARTINTDASQRMDQSGATQPVSGTVSQPATAIPVTLAKPIDPEGERDT